MPQPAPSVLQPLPLLHASEQGVEQTLMRGSGRDAVVSPDAAWHLTSVHTGVVTAELGRSDRFSAQPPGIGGEALARLDAEGRVRVGTAVAPGDILVGIEAPRAAPAQAPAETQPEGGASASKRVRDRSLRCPPHVRGTVVAVAAKERSVEVTLREERPLAVGDVLRTDTGEVAVVGAITAEGAGTGILWPGVTGVRRVQKVGTAFDALEARSIGPYSLVTQQPLGGKAQLGGQRVGPRTLQTLLDRGASVVVHEMLTVKSDDIAGRFRLFESIVSGRPSCHASSPESTRVLEAELRSLAFAVDLGEPKPQLRLLTTASIRELAPMEVKKPETLNYRTFQPEAGGLFCLEVFGPLQGEDRRRRLGRIELPVPVVPPWSRGAVAQLLGLSAAELEWRLTRKGKDRGGDAAEPDRPPTLDLRDALAALNLDALSAASGEQGQWARDLKAAGLRPVDLLVEAWPVLPPDLRPLVPLDGGRFATSDLNDLYRRLINRANRLRRLLELRAPGVILVNEGHMLQQALDALVHNGHWGDTVLGPEQRPLVSLTDLIGGERGRFALTSRGKRVDYSARARVVERSDLGSGHVRLPREMALELFKPWIYAQLEAQGLVTSIKDAKRLVTRRSPEALEALERVAIGYPVIVLLESDSDKVLSLDVQLWDAPAVALSVASIAAFDLQVGEGVVIHVPVDPLALEETRTRLRGIVELQREQVDEGWLSRAIHSPIESLGELLFQAALHRETDPGTSRLARLLLGRLP